jgi:hypothetical protein
MDKPEEEKIAFDDISFDDMLDGGVETEAPVEVPEVEEKPKDEAPASDELDNDAADKVDEEETVEKEEVMKVLDKEDDEEQDEDVTQDTDEESIVGQILTKLGYDVEEEYDDTTDGLLKLTQDVGTKMAEDQLDQLFAKFPLVKNHLEYVLNGGQSQDFMQAYDPQLDYNKIDIAEEDVRSQKAILSDYFTSKGHDADFINELLEDYEDTGKLYQKSQAAKNSLAQVQGQQRQQLIAQQKQQREQSQQEQQQFWNGVYETIESSSEFAGITVPKREKSKFFDYISKPVNKDGMTQRDLDHGSADVEVKLAMDYLMYKGFNLKNIINTKAKTKATKSLRERVSKNEASVKSARKASRRASGAVDLDSLDLNF